MSKPFDPITAIDDLLDGHITPADHAALDAWLTASPDNAHTFTERTRLHRNLHTTLTPERAASAGRADDPSEPESFPIYRKGHAPSPKSESRIPKSAIAFSIAAALLAACGLAIYLLAFNADPSDIEHRPSNIEHPPLATLIESTPGSNLTTPGGFISEGRDYPRGEYTLDRGTAEFMLTNSVNVKLRGDTRLFMRNNMNLALTRGHARFVVPGDAKGFTVHLPDGTQIVDLGTAFSVTVDEHGSAVLRVTEGLVRIDTTDHASRLVEAGASVQLDGTAVSKLAFVDLPIVNGDFETDPLADGDVRNPLTTRVAGWEQIGLRELGTYNPSEDHYAGSDDVGASAGVLGGMRGPAIAFAFARGHYGIEQITQHAATPGVRYELRVAVGHRSMLRSAAGYRIELLAGDRIIGFIEHDGPTADRGQFTDGVVTADPLPPDDPAIGESLTIRIRKTTEPSGYFDFDNVRLRALSPEPTQPSSGRTTPTPPSPPENPS